MITRSTPASKPPDNNSNYTRIEQLSSELIETFKNPSVTEALAKSLLPQLTSQIDETLQKNISDLLNTVKQLTAENENLTAQVNKLNEKNVKLNERLEYCETKILENERVNNRNFLVIQGLPESSYSEKAAPAVDQDAATADNPPESQSSVETTVINFIQNELAIPITSDQVNTAYRIKATNRPKRGHANSNNTSVRPIIVELTNTKIRNTIISSRRKLKDAGKKIYISEKLTKMDSEIFFEARKCVRAKLIASCWTFNGQVFIRRKPGPGQKSERITSVAELTQTNTSTT